MLNPAGLLDHPKLIAQLSGLERRTARSGRDSIDHAPGAHDDVANSCAGALLSALNAHKRRAFFGTYGYGGGLITWRDPETGQEIDPDILEPVERTRIRVVTIPEALAPAARGKSWFKKEATMGIEKVSDAQIAITIVPKRARWPEPGTGSVWAAAHSCVDAWHTLIRKIDLDCA